MDVAGVSAETFPALERLLLRDCIERALGYYSQNRKDLFVRFLESGITKCQRRYNAYENDIGRAYILLAAYFTKVAYGELGKRRAAAQAKVMNLFKTLDGYQRSGDRQLQIVKGFALMLSSGGAQDADAQFVSVLRQMPNNILALIGRGCLAFNRGDYIAALGYFKSVLMAQPQGPADVRVGIGHCFLKMGELDSARRSFEMALGNNSRCINAILDMAILKLNQGDKQAYQDGINLLNAAYELDQSHPVVLSILATHCYFSNNHDKVMELAGNAYRFSDIPLVMSQNSFNMARILHATGELGQAMNYYIISNKLAPDDYVLPLMGLAQLFVRDEEFDRAKNLLEKFLQVQPNEPSVMRLLAKIYLIERSPGQIDKAIEMLSEVVKKKASSRQDFDSRLSLAFAYEQKGEWTEAVNAYRQAMSAYSSLGEEVPIEWLNNLAATELSAKMPDQALETLKLAYSKCRAMTGEHQLTNLLTIRFNHGRIMEDLHRYDQAEILYKKILIEFPDYCDCFLRLGVMAMRQNKLHLAVDYFKNALKADEHNLTVRSYLADCYMKMNLNNFTLSNYNLILRESKKSQDNYVLTALGNFCLKKLHNYLSRGEKTLVKVQQKKAMNYYGKVLASSPRNLWAANGLGAALSSCGNLEAGGAIFRQIVEAGNECPPAILNSAHIALAQGQFKQAIQTYKQCLKEFLPENSVDVMHYLARALYGEGKTNEAKLWLLKARHLTPQDPFVVYNLALAIKEDAKRVLALPRPELNDLIKADLELKVAAKIFHQLPQEELTIPTHYAFKGGNECKILSNKLGEQLLLVRDLMLSNEDRARLQKQQFLAHQHQLQEQRLQSQEQQRVMRENQMAQRKEILARTKKIIVEPLKSEPSKKAPTKGKGKGRGKKNQKDVDDDSDQEAAQVPKRGLKRKKVTFADSDDDCKKRKKPKKPRKKTEPKVVESVTSKKYTSKEFIDTESSDSDEVNDKMRDLPDCTTQNPLKKAVENTSYKNVKAKDFIDSDDDSDHSDDSDDSDEENDKIRDLAAAGKKTGNLGSDLELSSDEDSELSL
ncbi:RNA polymerase-associated protein CTR9 homolog [Drosophila eugracilis]|uniref:RNA polymerase-associated protein CTR9 homolog n=1 Tax=Drosophila eugracilis TaxID=29029 RepID=UPI001BDAAFC1|nr:RNA polymerase-associated protein CTR9 homolog [Drosophila eugracilis]